MTRHRVRLLQGIVGTVTVLATIAAAQGPQGGQPDHWRLAPALTTSCFDDGFSERLDAARTAIEAEIEKQDKINVAARERYDKMDMMERVQKMQAFMMKDPQAAMKMMQAEQSAGTAANTALAEAGESSPRLEAELQRLQAAFKAATEQAVKPVLDKQAALIKSKTTPVGEAQVSMFTNAADHAQYVQLVAEQNAAFERACAPYFGPNGSFHKWATTYRTEVVDKLAGDGSTDAMMIMQLQAMDLPGGNYKSTVPMQQVAQYLHRIRNAWGIRPYKAKPSVDLKK